MNRSQNGILAEGQSLARDESLLWFGLPLTVSCFREYSDKKNTNMNSNTLAVVFTCSAEHTVLQHYITFSQKRRKSRLCCSFETTLSATYFEFC